MTGFSGGCLCGAVRYAAEGEPKFAGLCFCRDCQRASGSACVGFMGIPASRLRVTGETRRFVSVAIHGGEAVRNHCPACGSLLFGGTYGVDSQHTVYAGSLDDPAAFRPGMVIFGKDRPDWFALPEGVRVFETMPG